MKLTVVFDIPLEQKDFDDYADMCDPLMSDEWNKGLIVDDLTDFIFADDVDTKILEFGTPEELLEIHNKIQESMDKFQAVDLKAEIRSLEAQLAEAKAQLAEIEK